MNLETGSAHRVYGQLPNINLFNFQKENLDSISIKNLYSKLFFEYKDILNIDTAQVVHYKSYTDGELWFVSYRQSIENVPVYNTQIGYTINREGGIVSLGADAYQNVDVSTVPKLSSNEANEIAIKSFGIELSEKVNNKELVIFPKNNNGKTIFYLTWKTIIRSENPLKERVYFVDASTGNVIEEYSNLTRHSEYSQKPTITFKKVNTDTINTLTIDASFLTFFNQIQSFNVHGTISGSHYPEHYYDTPVNTNFQTNGIEIRNYIGQLVAQGNSNANGYYSINFSSVSSTHSIKIPFQNSWVKVKDGGNTISQTSSFYPGSNVQKKITWNIGNASNVRYHVSKAHDYFKNTHSYNAMDYQMVARINEGSSINGSSNGTEVSFGSYNGQQWARSSDVIYHEYTHNVTRNIYNGFIGGSQSNYMDEGISDYFASTINNDPNHGESVGVSRTLDNNYSYDPNQNFWWNGQVIGGAAWDVREAVGASVADNLVFKALQITPYARNSDDFIQNMFDADLYYYSGAHLDDIIEAAENHGIEAPQFPPPTANITGPNLVEQYETATWYSNASYGVSPYTYKWYKSYGGSWSLVSTSQNYTGSDTQTFNLKVEVTDSNSDVGEDTHGVVVTSDGCIICKEIALPTEFHIENNYPNPFNPSTTIKYELPEASDVSIKVYNIMGQQVATLVETNLSAGYHEVSFNAENLSSGLYIARIQIVGSSGESFLKEIKMQLIK